MDAGGWLVGLNHVVERVLLPWPAFGQGPHAGGEGVPQMI